MVESVSQLEYVVLPDFLGLQWRYPGPVNPRGYSLLCVINT